MSQQFDVAIIGGGIVGLATAMALSKHGIDKIVVLEAEDGLAAHQTGHNSGVIHSGLYYKPGSLKAKVCAEGREALYRFCEEHGIANERCGKVVVASRASEFPALDELESRGKQNGLKGIRRLKPEEVQEFEPYVACEAALHVPETGIVDYPAVTNIYAEVVKAKGGQVRTSSRVSGFVPETNGLVLETATGAVRARNLINCAGLQCDRMARMCGVDPGLKIVPFRGEYYDLLPEHHGLVNNLIYPVPDPRFPFLGVHFTRMIHGGIEAGPNAVLAFRREGYKKTSFSFRDVASWMFYGSFWKLAFKYWRMGMGEIWRSFSKGAFVKSMRSMIPGVTKQGVKRGGAGVRAQALAPGGKLVDDFHLVQAPRMIHVLNAPSPAATASISIGEYVADLAGRDFGLDFKE
jgi:L-2-hydroxyglutarate oxidase